MRRNKTKMIVALLAAVLVFNMAAFAQVPGDEVEMEFDFVEVPNGLTEDVNVDIDIEYNVEPDYDVEEAEAALMAAAEEGQIIAPGKVITYNGKTYRIKENAVNIAGGMGGFDNRPEVATSGEVDTLIMDAWNYNTTDGHDAPGCMELVSGTFIWRHYFKNDTLYVYSAWWKVQGGFNFDDAQRQIEGAYDPDTGASHVNEIGRNREITYGWQQDMAVFRGNSGERRFLYVPVNGGSVLLDDVYIYEIEAIEPLQINGYVVEDPSDWSEYTTIPEAGKDYNFVISYIANVTDPIRFNGIVAIFKDGKLVSIEQRQVNSRTATLIDGDLKSSVGTVSIPFAVPEGEDITRYSCIAYLGDTTNPFNVYGEASTSYAYVINGGQQ